MVIGNCGSLLKIKQAFACLMDSVLIIKNTKFNFTFTSICQILQKQNISFKKNKKDIFKAHTINQII